MPQMIRYRAETTPEAHLIEPVDGCPITIAEFHVSSVRLAHALERVRVGPGDCVASMLEASPLAVEVWMVFALPHPSGPPPREQGGGSVDG